MKKLVFVFGLMILSLQSQAQWSELTIQSYNQIAFNLILNGELLAKDVNDITITQLEAGQHHLLLTKSSQNSNGYFPIQTKRLFEGNIQVGQQQSIQAIIYQGQYIVLNQSPLNYGNQGVNNSGYAGTSNAYNTAAYDNYIYQGHNPYQQQGNQSSYIPGMNTHWNVPAPSCPTQGNTNPWIQTGPQAMNPASFEQLKQSIESQWFSSGQRDVFQQALHSNFFTSQQVFELVKLFTFSSDQLLVAKQAYTKTIDPQNYFVVNNALEFSSAVNALSSYIASL